MKKNILVLLIIILYPFTVEAKLSKEEIDSVGHFLALDFFTAKSPENRKPLTNIFYIKETGYNGQITDEEIELIELKGILSSGEYRGIIIINEVNGLGLLARNALINENGQVIWNDRTRSLMHFMFTPFMGNVSLGVTPLLKYENADRISELFKGCQAGEIPVDWEPSQADLDFYHKTLDVFYMIGTRSY